MHHLILHMPFHPKDIAGYAVDAIVQAAQQVRGLEYVSAVVRRTMGIHAINVFPLCTQLFGGRLLLFTARFGLPDPQEYLQGQHQYETQTDAAQRPVAD